MARDSFGSLPRRRRPLVVATVASGAEARRALRIGAEALELRMDLMDDPEGGPALLSRLRASGAPLIATCRPRGEGGAWRGPERARFALLARCAPRAWAVDLEASAAGTAAGRALRRQLSRGRTRLLLSRHDFSSTPPPATLRAWFSAIFRAGADVAKVAVTARRTEDLHHLFGALLSQRRPAVGISMGAAGAPSRVVAGLFGSVLTYGCVDAPRAPGQVRVDALRRRVEALFPGTRPREMPA
ncbi:MAG: type I 3-dehydroquinate dehydratase [Halobacteria archaeon]